MDNLASDLIYPRGTTYLASAAWGGILNILRLHLPCTSMSVRHVSKSLCHILLVKMARTLDGCNEGLLLRG